MTGIIGYLARLLVIADRRNTAELKRVNDAHDEEIAELKRDIAELRSEVDKLNADAQVERNPDKRRDLYVKSQRLILEDAPFVTLGYPQRAMGAKASVDGLLVGPLGDVVMRGVKVGG